MNCLFERCKKLKSIDLSCLDASNVIDTYRMFYQFNIINELILNNSFNKDKIYGL